MYFVNYFSLVLVETFNKHKPFLFLIIFCTVFIDIGHRTSIFEIDIPYDNMGESSKS